MLKREEERERGTGGESRGEKREREGTRGQREREEREREKKRERAVGTVTYIRSRVEWRRRICRVTFTRAQSLYLQYLASLAPHSARRGPLLGRVRRVEGHGWGRLILS